MPGIFGAYKPAQKEMLPSLMDRMIRSMDPESGLKVDRFMDLEKGLCMGRVSLGVLIPLDQPVVAQNGECSIIFHGELYGKQEKLSDPEYVLKLYKQQRDSAALELNGVFHFVIFDRLSGEIKLFNDKFGLQPLYYTTLSDGIVFGASVKVLLEDESISKEPDHRSFGDFLHYGQILGQKTLFKDIKLLAPGSILTFDLNGFKSSLKRYWYLEKLFVEKGAYDHDASLDDALSLLVESVRKRNSNKEILGLSLSGGLDSRGILAALGKHAEDLPTYTLGLSGCADQKLAERMARIANTTHEFIELDQEYLQDFDSMASNMIRLSDGMYHPHESTEMLALEYFKTANFKILLRGHGGEIAKAALAYPVMVDSQVHSFSETQETLSYILNITNLVIRDTDPAKLFTPSLCEVMMEAPEVSLKESCGEISEILAPPDVCIYYYINEHIRRQVVSSLEIFRTQTEIRLPYIDEAYLTCLLKLPVKYRNKGEVQTELIKKCMPGLIKIPDSNTGAPLDAGPFRLFVADKFNSFMRRFSIKGYRHYTEFQKWHRKSFSENSRKIIFNEQTRARNIYNMDYLQQVFETHMSGKTEYGHLLGTIVGLELWFRSFVD